MESAYDAYVKSEWDKFQNEPQRHRASLDAVHATRVQRVLDVGCGAGQELLPFVASGAVGIGADVAPEVGKLSRELFTREGYGSRILFVRSRAEQLPFRANVFDVLISRIALPYCHNRTALAESARVLRPDGTLLLKIHHGWYYVHKLWRGMISGDFLSSVHAGRVLATGLIYHVAGRQIRNRILVGETFQSRWLLRKELRKLGLAIVAELPDSNRRTPSFVIRRTGSSGTIRRNSTLPWRR